MSRTPLIQQKVFFYIEGQTVVLKFQDNGISDQNITTSDSFGLIGIRERVRHLHGTFQINRHCCKGTITKVTIQIPWRKLV